MNKSYTYSLIAVVVLAVVLVGTSAFLSKPADITDQTAAVGSVLAKTITWNTSALPSANVRINLIRKTGNNPATYSIVRAVSASTANTGSITWTPSAAEVGNDYFIEISCIAPTGACSSVITSPSL